jgi:hypothetical protein
MTLENTSTLMIHKPGSFRVSLDQLRHLPVPEAMGPRHRPIPHHILVDTIVDQVTDRGWTVAKQQLATARKGRMLFGLMDLRGPDTTEGLGTTFGFRSSTNQSFAIRGVAGARVFVCDNLALSGQEFVMNHKLTTRLNLPFLISKALNKFIDQSKTLMEDIEKMKRILLTDSTAKIRLFNLFNSGAMPIHLFDDVAQLYFKPQDEHPDCQPRSAWGLHNACTRAIKLLKPAAQFTSTIDVGRQFDLAAA